jgi:predicted MFS family arabinose efflux permease
MPQSEGHSPSSLGADVDQAAAAIPASPGASTRVVDRPFMMVTLSSLALYVAIGMLTPVLPRYLEFEFGAGRQALGIAVAALAVTSIATRPLMPWWMHRFGVRHLIITGAIVALASYVGNLAAGSIAIVCVLRGVAGIGESFHFVGSSAFINDRVDTSRRATATSYFSLSIFGGLAIGPTGQLQYGLCRFGVAVRGLGLLGRGLTSCPGA